LDGFDHHHKRVGFPLGEKRFDVGPFGGPLLLHRAHPGTPHRLPHDVLVAAGERVLLPVVADLEAAGQPVCELHARFCSCEDSDNGPRQRPQFASGLVARNTLVGGSVVMLHRRVKLNARMLRDERSHWGVSLT